MNNTQLDLKIILANCVPRKMRKKDGVIKNQFISYSTPSKRFSKGGTGDNVVIRFCDDN